jgi:hypothetical protein
MVKFNSTTTGSDHFIYKYKNVYNTMANVQSYIHKNFTRMPQSYTEM